MTKGQGSDTWTAAGKRQGHVAEITHDGQQAGKFEAKSTASSGLPDPGFDLPFEFGIDLAYSEHISL